jgi:hypothetical protein
MRHYFQRLKLNCNQHTTAYHPAPLGINIIRHVFDLKIVCILISISFWAKNGRRVFTVGWARPLLVFTKVDGLLDPSRALAGFAK